MQLIVNNDEMLGRTTDKTLHLALIEKDKEIERLKNVINELEKELKDWENLDLDNLLVVIRNIDKKLKELKEKK